MKFSNEIKVGLAIVAAAIVFFVGLRFFQDLPIFQGSYVLLAEFKDAGGLVSGNPVRVKGVNVGTVESVVLDQQEQVVRVRFRVENDVEVPEGSYAEVTGVSALGGVRLSINLGPADNPPLPPGSVVSGPEGETILERLSDQAPVLASKADSVLTSANATLSETANLLGNPQSNLNQTLDALRRTLEDIESITEAGKGDIRSLIDNLESVSADLRRFMGENGDSLDVAVNRLNRSLASLESNLSNLEQSTSALGELTTKMNEGDGTIARLVNDPGLYVKLDSAAARTNRILLDLKQNPGRYLEDMTLVKVF